MYNYKVNVFSKEVIEMLNILGKNGQNAWNVNYC